MLLEAPEGIREPQGKFQEAPGGSWEVTEPVPSAGAGADTGPDAGTRIWQGAGAAALTGKSRQERITAI